jgi:hypothetical protein
VKWALYTFNRTSRIQYNFDSAFKVGALLHSSAVELIRRLPTTQELPTNNSFDDEEAVRLFVSDISDPMAF